LWHDDSELDGCRRYLIWNHEEGPGAFRLFRTRREAREYIERRYGYIRHRPDLRAQPHGWHMPTAVPVRVVPE
jgi:hypothetical protein